MGAAYPKKKIKLRVFRTIKKQSMPPFLAQRFLVVLSLPPTLGNVNDAAHFPDLVVVAVVVPLDLLFDCLYVSTHTLSLSLSLA